MDIEAIYKNANAYLQGHFLLSSGKHSARYLQSAKVLEDPKVAELLATQLAKHINDYGLKVQLVCSPALGGILAGYELARALGVKFIFAERVNGKMSLRRGFEVQKNQHVLICEDIITTGGSALEAARLVQEQGGIIKGFAALANRGFCARVNGKQDQSLTCKLPSDLPLFALEDFEFEIYDEEDCPLCKLGTKAIKPGSRNN